MSKGTHCFDLLFATKLPRDLPSVVVAFGDGFLRQQTAQKLLTLAQINVEDAKTFDGESCLWRDVHDELATVSLFDPDERRVAIVKQGDDLVKAARPQLEKWFAAPVPSSLLLLELSSFAANTKLYKIAAEKGWCLECAAPKGKATEEWIKKWAANVHKLTLTGAQCGFILDRVGPEFGLLDQELAKAALYAGDDGKIADDQLKTAIGSWRTQTVWEIVAAAVEGRTANALEQLHKVIQAGESPMAIVPQMSWSLRRFGNATHLIAQAERARQKLALRDALARAGFRPFELGQAEAQLRRLGRVRGLAMLEWLLELDMKLKLSHSKEDRGVFAIEEFIVRLAGD
ncbi:MAG: DNA polymerase III subunit delta [Pirellulaceae bacterium]|nr:DNA polymerase III subunit delta [Pirellulaceae bacterium]